MILRSRRGWLSLASTVLYLLSTVSSAGTVTEAEACQPKVLSSRSRHSLPSKFSTSLDLFVCPGMEEAARHVFVDVHILFNVTDANLYRLYQGENCSVVEAAYEDDHRFFGLLKSVNLWRTMQLDPFSRTVVGVVTSEPYEIGLIVNPVSIWRAVLFFASIALYLLAPWFVRNAIVFYASGCTAGAMLSALFLVFILYRVAPKKAIGIPILIGGWSAAAWMAMHAWTNFSSVVEQYQKFIAAYFVSAMLVSFAYCYSKGPPTDVRSLDVATWFFQLVACCLIYFSSQVPWVSYSVIALLLSWSLLTSEPSKSIYAFFDSIWTYFFPRPRKLLTEDEYEREADEYTRSELAKLREFCRSPDANSWQITGAVKKPKRLARFVRGEDGHVTRDEEREYMEYTIDGERFFVPEEREAEEEEVVDSEYEREREEMERRLRERRRARRSLPAASQHRPSRGGEATDVSRSARTDRLRTVSSSSTTAVEPTAQHRANSSATGTPRTRTSTSTTAKTASKPRARVPDRELFSSDEDDVTQ